MYTDIEVIERKKYCIQMAINVANSDKILDIIVVAESIEEYVFGVMPEEQNHHVCQCHA